MSEYESERESDSVSASVKVTVRLIERESEMMCTFVYVRNAMHELDLSQVDSGQLIRCTVGPKEPKKQFIRFPSPKMDGYNGKILSKWMIWGYPHFRKPPYVAPYILPFPKVFHRSSIAHEDSI